MIDHASQLTTTSHSPSPALVGDGDPAGTSPSPSEPAGSPPTPTMAIDAQRPLGSQKIEAGQKLRVATSSPAPKPYSQFFYNLYREGSIYGVNSSSYADPVEAAPSLKRPRSEGERRIPDWVMNAQAAISGEPFPEGGPPLDPPLSPTAGAPFLPQSQRLKRRRDETWALRDDDGYEDDESANGDAISDTDRTCLEDDIDGQGDDDNMSETTPLGPPITEHQEYYQRCQITPAPPSLQKVTVTPFEELTDRSGQPQDLFEQLQGNIESLRNLAAGNPTTLAWIDQLESDAIIVVEMTKKLSRRVCFLEKHVEDFLPELEDEKANAALLENLNYRLQALEQVMSARNSTTQHTDNREQIAIRSFDSRVGHSVGQDRGAALVSGD